MNLSSTFCLQKARNKSIVGSFSGTHARSTVINRHLYSMLLETQFMLPQKRYAQWDIVKNCSQSSIVVNISGYNLCNRSFATKGSTDPPFKGILCHTRPKRTNEGVCRSNKKTASLKLHVSYVCAWTASCVFDLPRGPLLIFMLRLHVRRCWGGYKDGVPKEG